MKKLKVMMMTLMMCLVSMSAWGQLDSIKSLKYEKIFLKDLYVAYENCYFKFDETSISEAMFNKFYFSFSEAKQKYSDNVAYPSSQYKSATTRDSLLNRYFKVINVLDKDSNKITQDNYSTYPILVMRDIKNGEILYFMYDKIWCDNFYFLTTTPNINKDIIVKNITTNYDEINNEKTFTTPYELNIQINRIYTNGNNVYYLSFETLSSYLTYDSYGIVVLFTDGTKWQRLNEKVEVDYNNGDYKYSTFTKISKDELKLFQNKTIKKFKMYIFDEVCEEGYIFKKYAQQIDKIK